MAWASASSRARSAGSGAVRSPTATRFTRSSAQKRLTAVGRVAARPLIAVSRSARNASNVAAGLVRAARATPNAAATPIAGAPRTTSVRIAAATSSQVAHARSTSSRGSRVWSSRCRRSPCHLTGAILPRAARGAGPREEPPLSLGPGLVQVRVGQPEVALDRDLHALGQLPVQTLEGVHVRPDPRLLRPRLVEYLLAPELGLVDDQLRLPAGGGLELLAHALAGN